jgi:hypothetical protein
MKRSEVVWSQAIAPVGKPSLLSATITNKDGLEWMVAITHEPYSTGGGRLSVTLTCRSAGRMNSTNTLKSVDEAQEWCYKTLGAE